MACYFLPLHAYGDEFQARNIVQLRGTWSTQGHNIEVNNKIFSDALYVVW